MQVSIFGSPLWLTVGCFLQEEKWLLVAVAIPGQRDSSGVWSGDVPPRRAGSMQPAFPKEKKFPSFYARLSTLFSSNLSWVDERVRRSLFSHAEGLLTLG